MGAYRVIKAVGGFVEMRTLKEVEASRAQRLYDLTRSIESFESQVSRLPRFNRTVNKNS